MSADLDQLEHFFSAYFHEDWVLEGDNWEDIVKLYISHNQKSDIEALSDQIEILISEIASKKYDSSVLQKQLGCYNLPEVEDLSATDWLSGISQLLRKRSNL